MVAHAHVLPMQRVDRIKIPPHEPIATVHRVESTLENAGPRIELAASIEAIALKRFRRHVARHERNPIVAVSFVEPPAFVKQATFGLQPGVKRCARKRGEVIEGRDVKRVRSRKIR